MPLFVTPVQFQISLNHGFNGLNNKITIDL